MALNYRALDGIICAALLPAALIVLDTIGVPELLEELKKTVQRWCRGNGWHFAWGWSKTRAEEMPRDVYNKGCPDTYTYCPDAQTYIGAGPQDNVPYVHVRQYGKYF
jgi:hypothetical protein